MKIGIFTDSYHPLINGVIVSIDNFTRELRKKGHTVYIIAPKIKGYTDKDKRVIRMPAFKMIYSAPEVLFPLPIPDRSLQQIYRLDLDLIHAHGSGAFSLIGYQAARMKGIPYVHTFHTVYTEYTHYLLNGMVIRPPMVVSGLRTLGNISDGVTAPSEKMKEKLIAYGVKKPIVVIPNFIDYKLFGNKKSTFLYEQCGIPRKSPILLSVGRLGKEKNFAFVIKTFAKLITQKNALPKESVPHLVVVGQGMEEKPLKQLVDKLGISDRVHFTGKIPVDQMPEVYASASIYVFASVTETQGVCVVEAAASGLPLVVAKDDAFSRMVIDGKTGYLLPLTQKDFVEKLTYLLKKPEVAKQLGIAAKKTIQENFVGEELTDELITFYEYIISIYNPKAKVLRKINRATIIPIIRATAALNRFLMS